MKEQDLPSGMPKEKLQSWICCPRILNVPLNVYNPGGHVIKCVTRERETPMWSYVKGFCSLEYLKQPLNELGVAQALFGP